MDELLTISQVAKRAGMPETTVRRYVSLFQSFTRVRTYGRTKKYPVEVVDLVRSIGAMYEAGKETVEINAILQQTTPQVIEGDEAPETALINVRDARGISTLLEAQAGLIRAIRDDIQAINDRHHEETSSMLEEVRALREQLDELQRQLNERPEPKPSLWSRITGTGSGKKTGQ